MFSSLGLTVNTFCCVCSLKSGLAVLDCVSQTTSKLNLPAVEVHAIFKLFGAKGEEKRSLFMETYLKMFADGMRRNKILQLEGKIYPSDEYRFWTSLW